MPIIISIIVLLLSVSMFCVKRTTKLKIILISCICLNFASFAYVSFGTAANMVSLAFFLSEFKYIKVYIKNLRGTPFKSLMLIVTIGTLIVLITSKHAHNPISAAGLLINDLICKYFVLIYAYVAFSKSNELRSLYNISYYSLLIITFFSLLTVVTGHAFVSEISGNELGVRFANSLHRVRIVSTFRYPFDYGFACNILLIMFLYGNKKRLFPKVKIRIAIVCCLIGIITCGCRTVMVTSVVSLLVFFYISYPLIKSFAYLIAMCLVTFFAYFASEKVQYKIDNTLTAFDPDAAMEQGGSSTISGRQTQYLAAYALIENDMAFGRGYRFFTEDLGYGKNGNGQLDLQGDAKKLLGLEGVLMSTLLERGFVGVTVYFLFYLGLIVYAIRCIARSRDEAAVVLSIIIGYICYSNMTGELNSGLITFFISGYFFKLCKLRAKKHYHKTVISIPESTLTCIPNTV